MTWKKCVIETEQNNAEIHSALENLDSLRYTTRAIYGSLFPQISATLSTTRDSSSLSANSPQPTSNTYSIGLALTQNLFSGFYDKARIEQAESDVRASEARVAQTRAQVLYDLKTAYADLLFAQRSEDLQQSFVDRRQENLRLVTLKFQAGRENRGSVLLSKASLSEARLGLMQAQGMIVAARSKLARILGRDEDTQLTLSSDIPLSLPPSAPNFKSIALHVPEHQRALASESSSESAVIMAKASFYPSLSLSGSLSKSGDSWFPQNTPWSVGLNLSIPLFSGGRDYNLSRSAIKTFAAQRSLRENTDRKILSDLKLAYTNYLVAIEKLKVATNYREAALKRAEIARSKYNNGLLTFDEWDLIENDLIVRESAALQSQRDQSTFEANWVLATGGTTSASSNL